MKLSHKFLAEIVTANELRALLDRRKMLSYVWWEKERRNKESQPKKTLWAMEERATALNDEFSKHIAESENGNSFIGSHEEEQKEE